MGEARRLVLLHEHDNPSLAYFESSICERFAGVPVRKIDIATTAANFNLIESGDVVVIIRYVTFGWRTVLQARYRDLAGLAYFMDDDLLDPEVLVGLPQGYARRLRRKAVDHASWLRTYCSQLWVSTPSLCAKYGQAGAQLLEARPVPVERIETPVRVVYHGTLSHRAEIEWLHDVMKKVVEREPRVEFQLFGDAKVNALYRDVPRVLVLHTMSWPSYLRYTSTHLADIGLAPLLPARFNHARGPVKFFDYARMGAVGIYSDIEPYKGFVRQAVDGLLIDNEPEHWVAAVCQLVRDDLLRSEMKSSVQLRTSQHSSII